MIDTDKYEGHTPAPWRVENGSIHAKADWWSGMGDMIFFSKRHGQDANSQLIADAPLLLEEVKRLHKNKSNLFTTIEQKLNEKGDEGEAIWEAYPDGHYKEDQLRGWCEALEFVLSLMKAQEREE